jgi:hypothetical protein
VTHHKKIPVIADEFVGCGGVRHLGRPVLKVLNQGLRVGGEKDIAFDDAVVKNSINDIRHNQTLEIGENSYYVALLRRQRL